MTVVYKDQAFPLMTVAKAKCVLCQEPVTKEASERLRAFDTFCKDQSQQLSADAAKRLSDVSARIKPLDLLATSMRHIEADISSWSQDQKEHLKAYINAADKCLAAVKKCLQTKNWNEISALPQSPEIAIQELAAALDARAIMEESAVNPEARLKLTAELDELAAKEWLVKAKMEVISQIDRHMHVSLLGLSQKDATTRTVTEKSTELTKRLVTETFCKRFEFELKQLGLRTITVKLEDIKGKKGETRFGLRLDATSPSKVNEIASEGEKRCIALAAFLAELSQASHKSSLVFDDPVSSLDHSHRYRIAARLVQESQTRQVIVFTHDAVFLNDLQTHSLEQSVSAVFRCVEWHGSSPGRCTDGLPWDHKTPEERIDKLEKEQRAIAAVWQPQPNESNVSDMRKAYSWLRATLERIVERVVFADVVFRFRSFVNFKNLQNVVGFADSECTEILRLHKRCCDVTEAHDAASGKQAPVPGPADLSKDIADTKTLLAAIRQRAKTKKSGSGTRGVPGGTSY